MQDPEALAPLRGGGLFWAWVVAVAAAACWSFALPFEIIVSTGRVMVVAHVVVLGAIVLNTIGGYQLRSTNAMGRTRLGRLVRTGVVIVAMLIWFGVVAFGAWRLGWHSVGDAVIAAVAGFAMSIAALVLAYATAGRLDGG